MPTTTAPPTDADPERLLAQLSAKEHQLLGRLIETTVPALRSLIARDLAAVAHQQADVLEARPDHRPGQRWEPVRRRRQAAIYSALSDIEEMRTLRPGLPDASILLDNLAEPDHTVLSALVRLYTAAAR